MNCPNCGNIVPDTANVCGICGTRLRQPLPPAAPIIPAYSTSFPASLISQKRTIPVWAWIIGIFICLFMAVVLIWAVFFSNISINLGSSQPASLPTTAIQSHPGDTPVPPQPTSVVEPSNTSAPPTPTAVTVPDGISSFLLNAEILEHDPFSTQDPTWVTSEGGLKWTYGALEMTGAIGFATSVLRGTLEKGQAILFLMQYTTADMDVNFLIEKGEWQTPNYYRYGVNLKGEAKTDIWKGTSYLGDAKFIGNLQFEMGKYYFFLLALDSEQEFAAIFWEAGNHHTYTMIRQGQVKDWPASGWIIVVKANAGKIIFDEFFLVQFDEFAF